MKSQHRHELKTNELAEWIANLPQWAKQNAKTIIASLTAVIIVAGLCFYYLYQKNVVSAQRQVNFTNLIARLSQTKIRVLEANSRGMDLSYTLIKPADNLKILAQNTKDHRMAALALIKRAEALRAELHYRPGTVSPKDITTQVNLAKTSYAEAIEQSSSAPSLMAKAKFGVGLCEEELGNFDQARQIYSDITENPDFEGTIAASQAARRLKTMADYRKKVTFKTSSKPTPAAPMKPQIKIIPSATVPVDTGPNDTSPPKP